MLRRLRGASRKPATAPAAPSASDVRMARAVQQLVAGERARVLQADDELDRRAEVKPDDIGRAESFWDEAQRRADTGLDGLLSATEDTDG